MNEDFLDLLSSFVAAKARFLVIGAYAVGIHGHPRATKDLDVWVDATPENAARVLDALHAFGAPLGDLTASDLDHVGTGFKMGTRAGPRRTGREFDGFAPARDVAALTSAYPFAVFCRISLSHSACAASGLASFFSEVCRSVTILPNRTRTPWPANLISQNLFDPRRETRI